MPKQSVSLVEVERSLLEEAQEVLTRLTAVLEDGSAKPARESGEKSDEQSDGGETELPSLKEIKKLDEDELKALAEKLNLSFDEDADEDTIRAVLVTLSEVSTGSFDEDGDDADDAIKNLAVAIGIKPSKKLGDTLTQVREYYGLDEATDKTEDADEEPKGKAKDKAKDDEDDDDQDDTADEEDGVDYDTAIENADPVKFKVQLERLNAFNEVADDRAIQFDDADKDAVAEAYTKLQRRLVDSEGNLAEWGAAYVRAEGGWCCGLPLKEIKVKGDKRDCGECVVTGTKFAFDDGAFEELE